MDQPVDDQVGEQRLHVRVEEGQPRVHRNITTEELVVVLFAAGADQPRSSPPTTRPASRSATPRSSCSSGTTSLAGPRCHGDLAAAVLS
ncbi:hypothetical protein QYE76_063097 [Lolium multiflorum]|uniref:Uncharacterized protein n=1 Tax=Lolium multiflorum TaxID=4521 RepID=A0AAD8S4B4_LOLMU|nr:hypothetical protein QYE76_063097 [Lolium multiflorum]